jgi:hypothetical protein
MVHWINKHKTAIQWLVLLLGVALVVMAIVPVFTNATGNMQSRGMRNLINGVSKPAEVGLYFMVGLLAIRLAYHYIPFKALGRLLLRTLQIIHVPLGIVVLLAAMAHGILGILFSWESNFHNWVGVLALVGLTVVAVFGWVTITRRKTKMIHRTLGLVVFVLALVHIFVSNGNNNDRQPFSRGAAPFGARKATPMFPTSGTSVP